MAGKVMKFAEKVKKIKRTDTVPFTTDEGETIEFKVESRFGSRVEQTPMIALRSSKPSLPCQSSALALRNGSIDTGPPMLRRYVAFQHQINRPIFRVTPLKFGQQISYLRPYREW
ncbi:hypothetical protein [Bacillus licheniformis]|uniref:hypothetical protein n=1 Tax=Bacillus licheniformis TaxID=1402 RepID=UPI0008FAE3BD|nr:hypothetical protein [Bacillus licheniformis]OIS74611.1 hypothetical protein A4A40_18735 [Bacillus licheniformis]OIS80636.1 hypothetical protein A4A43_09520 [Bacillus licheniformis]OIS82219.1 hypothetical protein A4A38_05485 [Bacillus licheniformis]OIS89988.1 hypothetical protein A4A42_00200 [Bacillus licheniformis]